MHHGVVRAVRLLVGKKKVCCQDRIDIEEPAGIRIKIPTSEVIQPGLFVVHISTLAERLHRAQRAGHATSLTNRLTPRIVLILYHSGAVAVKNGHKVALQVLHIAVRGPVESDNRRLVLRIIEEVQVVIARGHVHDVLTM